MNVPVCIAATGARTPLGLQAAPSAAAVRAGIIGLGEHPFMVDQAGDLMRGALDSQLDPGLMGPERLLALAETALKEACAPLAHKVRASRPQLPVYLGLPEIRPGFTEQDAEAVRAGIARFNELPIEISEVNIATQGHAAGLSVLAIAARQIRQGAFEACLVGGVESYFHPDTMEWLDENRQLASADARSAFVPGEGAGFCLLMSQRACWQLGFSALAQVRAVAIGKETKLIKTEDICLGEGLTAVVQRAVNGLTPPSETINAVICDINGERYRGEEWGFVCLRLGQYFDDPTGYCSPTDYWGDMGAASGPLFATLVCQSAARDYAEVSRTLLWASSEGGLRATAVLETRDH